MKLLVTGAYDCSSEQLEELSHMGHEILFLKQEKDDVPCPYEEIEGVICNGLFLYHPIEKFVHLRFIQLTSAGYDRVPMDYIREHQIEIHNARGVYSIPIAEFVISEVLAIYKQSCFFMENQKKHIWLKNRNLMELNQKNVLIVGCGSVGKECAKRFQAFNCKVMGIDLKPFVDSNFDSIYSIDSLNDSIEKADVIVLTVPLMKETYHMWNEDRFKLMKEDAVLVNVARGALIDTEALLKHVDNMKAAILDVLEEEPLASDSPLWNKENVIIRPHNSFVGDHNRERLDAVIKSNLWK